MNRYALLALLAAVFAAESTVAQTPAYQRTRTDQSARVEHHRPGYRHFPRYQPPRVQSGTFQRPYPYHLDFYRREYGGSYDPYFGNLYGPPNVVLSPGYGVIAPPVAAPAAAPFVCPNCGHHFAPGQ